MGNNGQQWIKMDNNGQTWTTMDNNGQQTTFKKVLWKLFQSEEKAKYVSFLAHSPPLTKWFRLAWGATNWCTLQMYSYLNVNKNVNKNTHTIHIQIYKYTWKEGQLIDIPCRCIPFIHANVISYSFLSIQMLSWLIFIFWLWY